jgi:hypothetical protein
MQDRLAACSKLLRQTEAQLREIVSEEPGARYRIIEALSFISTALKAIEEANATT